MAQLGRNADGEVLVPDRVPDCYLGLRLDPDDGGAAGVLVVARRAAASRRPTAGQALLYELVTGHPDRAAHELVFVAILTRELRAWPQDTWAKVDIDANQSPKRSSAAGRPAKSPGCRSTTSASRRPARSPAATTYVRGQLRGRLTARLARIHRRWLHPTQRPPTRRPLPQHRGRRATCGAAASAGVRNPGRLPTPATEASGSVCGSTAPVPTPAARVGHGSRTPTMLTAPGGGPGLRLAAVA